MGLGGLNLYLRMEFGESRWCGQDRNLVVKFCYKFGLKWFVWLGAYNGIYLIICYWLVRLGVVGCMVV